MKNSRRDIFKFAGGAVAGALFTPAPWRLITDTALWSENWPGLPQPPGHRAQLVNLARISPRAGRGMPGQFSLHSAVSVIRRHGAGVKRAPATAPPANLKMSRRELVIYDSPGNYVPGAIGGGRRRRRPWSWQAVRHVPIYRANSH